MNSSTLSNAVKPLAIVILAAGKGSRMRSPLPKVMHKLAGKPMINWLLDSCAALNPDKIIVVAAPDMDDVAAAAAPHDVVFQTQQNGTADAVKPALPLLAGFDGQVLILMGDEPLIPLDALRQMIAHDGLSALVFNTPHPHGLGRVLLNVDGSLQNIIEEKDCDAHQKLITLCNAGTYCVPARQLKPWLEGIGNNNAQGEYYLTDMPKIAAAQGFSTHTFTIEWTQSWGVNTRVQLAAHEAMAQNILRERHLNAGVWMQDPSTVYLWHDTKIGEHCRLEPNVYFGARVVLESGVNVKAFSHLEDAHVGANSTLGPFARLRPGAEIGEDVKIGNFVEVKKSTVGDRVKLSHFAYVGDADIGEDTNFGCGAITVNYDGFNKHRTMIGKNVMIGSNVNLIAPIEIHDGAFIAAGSTITDNAPQDALVIARSKSEVREGWAAKFRKLKNNTKEKRKAS